MGIKPGHKYLELTAIGKAGIEPGIADEVLFDVLEEFPKGRAIQNWTTDWVRKGEEVTGAKHGFSCPEDLVDEFGKFAREFGEKRQVVVSMEVPEKQPNVLRGGPVVTASQA